MERSDSASSGESTETEAPLSQETGSHLQTLIPTISDRSIQRFLQQPLNELSKGFGYSSEDIVQITQERRFLSPLTMSPPESPEGQNQYNQVNQVPQFLQEVVYVPQTRMMQQNQQPNQQHQYQQFHTGYQYYKDNCHVTSEDIRSPGSCASPDSVIPLHLPSIPGKGRYMFELHFEKDVKPPSKSCHYTYSDTISKLFVQPLVPIPIAFKTALALPSKEAEIRCFMKFSQFQFENEAVERCPLHLKNDSDNDHKKLVLQSTRSDAEYIFCPTTKRHVFSFRPKILIDSCNFQESLKIACSSSCRGGINRRPVQIVFVLYVSGKIQGHVKLDIHISSCPGRDRKSAEKKYNDAKNPDNKSEKSSFPKSHDVHGNPLVVVPSAGQGYPAYQIRSPVEPSKRSLSSSSSDEGKPLKNPLKKPKLITYISEAGEEDDDNIYQLQAQVRGYKNAKCLSRIIGLMAAVPDIRTCAINRVREPMVLNNSGFNNLTDPVPPSTNELKFEKIKSRVKYVPDNFQRSVSDSTHYKQQYRKVTVALISDLKEEEPDND